MDQSGQGALQKAALCLWIAAGLTLVVMIAQISGVVPGGGAVTVRTGIFDIGSAGLLALVAAKIAAGRGWAKWLYAVVYGFGSLLYAILVAVLPRLFIALPSILKVNVLVQFVLETAAMILIFSVTAQRWLRRGHAALGAVLIIEVVFGFLIMLLMVLGGALAALEADRQMLIFGSFGAAGIVCFATPCVSAALLYGKDPNAAVLVGGTPTVLAVIAGLVFVLR